MARIELDHVTKRYPGRAPAVNDLTLDISDGVIRIGDRALNDLATRERDVAMVFQNCALYPHLGAGVVQAAVGPLPHRQRTVNAGPLDPRRKGERKS